MKSLITRLASLKLTVGLLVVILIALAAGTIIESLHGTAAARAVYYSLWFELLLGLFAINLVAALIERWPWGKFRVGFALTHGAMLLILVGAMATVLFKVEGQLVLWEGQESSSFARRQGDRLEGEVELPFSIRLDDFQIDYYPGTRRPAMFRSKVEVTDPAAGTSFPYDIEMNKELAYGGYRFFQSSYQISGGREMTVLSVSRDPGQIIVFWGYGLLMLGMAVVIGTRIAQRRMAAELEAAGRQKAAKAKRASRAAAALLLPLLLLAVAPAAWAQGGLDPATLQALRTVPVQHDGRVMPLDTLAREAAREVTGFQQLSSLDPVEMVTGWMFAPERWLDEPVVRLGSRDLVRYLGLAPGTRYLSFRELANHQRFLDLIGEARRAAAAEQPLAPVQKDALELEARMVWMQRFFQHEIVRLVPVADPAGAWGVPEDLSGPADLLAVEAEQRQAAVAGYPSEAAMAREVTYNQVRPSRWSWWLLAMAAVASLLTWLKPRRWLDVVAVGGLLAGLAVMTWGLATRWLIAGRIPASNMYESLLFLGWGVALFALLAAAVLRNRLVLLKRAAMAALTMALTDQLPIHPFVHPMPPVLSGTPWLAIHVPIIMVSYSVLAVGVLVAHMQIGVELFRPQRRDLVASLNDHLYWYMHVGSLLLIAGILTGSIWAASSWGRYWGWDPKEVWSLVAFLAYMAILHGRFDRFLGAFGVAVASIVAFWAILMTYVGVNFILSAGLHSYGFGSSSVVRWMVFVAAAEALFLLTAAYLRGKRAPMPGPPSSGLTARA